MIDNNMSLMTVESQKNISLELLKYFADFCEKHNLTYYLAYGTLLGAIRHKGYIPWDDDIDVFMPREDYLRFISIYNSEKTVRNYDMVTPYDDDTIYSFVKLYDNNTVKIEEGVVYPGDYFGVDIDIFPIDRVSDDVKYDKVWKKIKKCYFYMSLLLLNKSTRPLHKRIVLSLIDILFSRERLQKKVDKLIKSISKDDGEYYVDLSCPYAENARKYPIEWFNQTCSVDFESYQFKAPIDYDKLLTAFYGDYMTPPPLNKQVTHHLNNCFKKQFN